MLRLKMQILDYNEVKNWDVKELDAKLVENRKAVFELRMEKGIKRGSSTALEKPHALKIAKKNIAKILTAKNAKGE